MRILIILMNVPVILSKVIIKMIKYTIFVLSILCVFTQTCLANNFNKVGKRENLIFFGQGITQVKTTSSLVLVCIEQPCTQVRWVFILNQEEAFYLGKPMWVREDNSSTQQDYYDLSINSHKSINTDNLLLADLNQSGMHQDSFKFYINGLAKEAKNEMQARHPGLFYSVSHVYYDEPGMAYEFVDGSKSEQKLQTVNKKNGWNWSEHPKSVSKIYFKRILAYLMKKTIEDGVIQFSGIKTLDQYLREIQTD